MYQIVLDPQAARIKLFDHTVTLDGLSVSSHAAIKYLGVIITSLLLFLFHPRNIAKIINIMSLHDTNKNWLMVMLP